MLGYYLYLGLRSLRRNPVLTALMVLAIGFGVGASMTTYAVFRAVSGNPLPDKSNQLFVPQIDNWGPRNKRPDGKIPDSLSYIDAMALMQAHQAQRQTAIYPVGFNAVPQDTTSKPFAVRGYATYSDFFSMFEVPFRYGGGWAASQDEQRGNVVVISNKLNQKLFGDANGVGHILNLDGHDYSVVGVTRDWNPQPRFYDVNNGNGFAATPDVFMPFTRAIDIQTHTSGGTDCSGTTGQAPGWQGLLNSGCVWISFWAELPSAQAIQHYQNFLENYAADQQRSGRFQWVAKTKLDNLTQWLDQEHAVPPESSLASMLSLGFLLVCLVNTIGLLLAKFMRRASEIGVRRALGASRLQIHLQFLAEAAMVGLAGGLLGLLLTVLGVFGTGLVFDPEIARLAHVNPSLVALTLLLALFATLVAAFYPTWRAARVQPAWQLKSN